jgi:hypothetical protein
VYYSNDYAVEEFDPFFAITSVQGWLFMLSMFFWALNSIQYFKAWLVERKDWVDDQTPFWSDLYMWGNMLNVWGMRCFLNF